ncbi:MAG: alpha/beta hydrolase [Hyphomicrobiaceae bacterium]|nr:MAG: alpha/beta hydrolase [Hyphomicrobiaceae bacterium]
MDRAAWAQFGFRSSEPRGQAWRDIYFTNRDGLRLYGRHYPASSPAERRPAVCLPGLTRNSRDFHDLALALSAVGPGSRDVYTLDYRGRGRSEHDKDWRNYSPYIEMLDVLDFLAREELSRVAMIGTSRGGIIAMVMGAFRPTAIGAVVLNDIGPVLEKEGLVRIMGYVGRQPVPDTWERAAEAIRRASEQHFPDLPDELWLEVAHQLFNDANGRPSRGYDYALGRVFTLSDLKKGLPPLWPQFLSLGRVPLFAIRGANSDLLSAKTLEEMAARHPRMRSLTVSGQGHAPLLKDFETNTAIATFLAEHDR